MEKYSAPHEKLTKEEIKKEIDYLLSNHLKFKNKWKSSEWEADEFDQFMKNQEESIFKLRRHFNPKRTKIMKVSIAELSDMMGYDDG